MGERINLSQTRQSVMWDYISEIPDVSTRILNNDSEIKEASLKINKRNKNTLVMIGYGSSFNAALIAKSILKDKIYWDINVITPSEFNARSTKIKSHEIYILISQEGNSSGVIDLIGKLDKSETVGFSSGKNNLLSESLDYHIDIQSGNELSNAKTKGVTSTILSLTLFSLYLSNYDNDSISEFKNAVKNTIANFDKTKESFFNYFSDSEIIGESIPRSLCFVYSDDDYGIAAEAMIKLTETLLIPTVGVNISDFSHGTHRYITNDDVLVLFSDGSNEYREHYISIYNYYAKLGVNVIMIKDSIVDIGEIPNISYFYDEFTNSFMSKLLIVQLISVLLPENFTQDPNVSVHQDIVVELNTRK